ncbi:hypothetical protein NDU88_004893 [Pleurodeles waltl]|uniref:Uncharacterized protein n=1 Tax=Pleurodeles waltl TaxID=8319 RepID=A0AAV7KZM9_PLEWA|nr:hypothetical protein NDU88_004893 [Pleurodeles waltl]
MPDRLHVGNKYGIDGDLWARAAPTSEPSEKVAWVRPTPVQMPQQIPGCPPEPELKPPAWNQRGPMMTPWGTKTLRQGPTAQR